MKRTLSLICLLLFLLPLIVSCSTQDASPMDDAAPSIPDGDVIYPENGGKNENETSHGPHYQNDRIPTGEALTALGFAGSEVKLLTWTKEEAKTFPVSDSTTDPLKSRLWFHWRAIEERLSITFSPTYVNSEWAAKDEFLTAARAEGATYDLIQTQSLFPMELALEGRLCNLQNLGYPDLEMPWWPNHGKEWSCNGALYFIMSNSSVMGISNMCVTYVHENMITAKGGTSPVKSVLEGTWTVEEMTKIAKLFAGAAEQEESTRIYGLVVDDPSRMDAFYYSCGFSSVTTDEMGTRLLGYDEEAELNAITQALEGFRELINADFAVIHSVDDYTELDQSRTAMFVGYMDYVDLLSNPENYRVIPLPMLDTKQYDTVGYRTALRDLHDVWCMPTTTANKTLSGIVLEANASSEYRIIAPYYYEQFLKDRYASGSDGRKCFDILRDSVVCDFGRVGQIQGIGAESYWRACFYKNGISFNNSFASSYKANATTENSPSASLQKILTSFATYRDQ